MRARYLPRLEQLEKRLTPSTVDWNSWGDGHSWSDPENWMDDQGIQRIPTGADVVTIEGPAGAFTIDGTNGSALSLQCSANLDWNGTLSITENSEVLGDFDFDGTLTISHGALSLWDGGRIAGTVALVDATFSKIDLIQGEFVLVEYTSFTGDGWLRLGNLNPTIVHGHEVNAENAWLGTATLSGYGDFIITEHFVWAGGEMVGISEEDPSRTLVSAPLMEVTASGTLRQWRDLDLGIETVCTWSDGNIVVKGGAALNNSGEVIVQGGDELRGEGNGTITNLTPGVFELNTGLTIKDTVGDSAFNNLGTFRQAGTSPTTSTVEMVFNNAGLVATLTGIIIFKDDGIMTGTINTDALALTSFAAGVEPARSGDGRGRAGAGL